MAKTKKPLRPGCQSPPARDVKSRGLWPPKDGTAYPVSLGESWGSLAKDWGFPAKHIIGYNFRTIEPPEVNWYLDKYVGCELRTKDKCNWRFSSALKTGLSPGTIYRPPAGWDPYKTTGDPVTDFDWDKPGDLDLPESPLSTEFEVRLRHGGSGGYVIAIDALVFDIRNRKTKEVASYLYEGFGLGVSLKVPVGASFLGPWNRFRTAEPLLETDFDGFTRFTVASAADIGVGILHLVGTPEGVPSVYIQNFDSGLNVGASMSFTFGDLSLLD